MNRAGHHIPGSLLMVAVAVVGSALLCAAAAGRGVIVAAEDDISEFEPPLPKIPNQPPLPKRRIAFHDPDSDELVFDGDSVQGRQTVERQINQALNDIAADYDLTEEEHNKLLLASQADKIRFHREVEELQLRFEVSRSNGVRTIVVTNRDDFQTFTREAAKLQIKQQKLLGADSFFEKVTKKILAGKPLIVRSADPDLFWSNQSINRHRANVEATARAVVAEQRQLPTKRIEPVPMASFARLGVWPSRIENVAGIGGTKTSITDVHSIDEQPQETPALKNMVQD